MKIIVFGAGAWGTALAISASSNPLAKHQVTLWARDAQQAALMQARRENQRYLPGVALPASLRISSAAVDQLAKTVNTADVCIIATPMSGLRGMLAQLRNAPCPVAWLCKGVEAGRNGQNGLLGHEIYAQTAAQSEADQSQNHPTPRPQLKSGVLSGPSFALEVARGQPTALVAASEHAEVRAALVEAFHSPVLRVYASEDVVGVEVGGAVKNVLAIATGLCDGLGLGLNARAALITRGLAEMTRLGLALGAKTETFMGLSGLGDLVLTSTGDLSRNRKVGLLLAQGNTLEQAVASLGHVAEGVYCARTVSQRALSLGVDMPITQCVVQVLDGTLTPLQAVERLMGRDATEEL
ncbi:MAG: NAD(P)H-dependent glycerol-3-phosphate dehydrogenase [Burkholderiaceae bacterium]|nr:NAD(P)H-dependent glycerol-3-phosphate dehydrogenase [Burkholderiaceae bacterium]